MKTYFKDLINPVYWLVAFGCGLLTLGISFGIYYPLSRQGIITIKEAPGLSSIWVNWEIFITFGLVFALVAWLGWKVVVRLERKNEKPTTS